MTATLEVPQTAADNINETLARYHRADAAVRRKAAGQQTADDALVLEMHGIEGDRLRQEIERLNGITFRKERAGNPDSIAAAEHAYATAADAHASGQRTIGTKVDKLRAELAGYESQLRDLKTAEAETADALKAMRFSREQLVKLLPAGLREQLVIAERPVRAKHAKALADARHAVSMATHLDSNTTNKLQQIQNAERRQKEIEAACEAECATVCAWIRDFYFDV